MFYIASILFTDDERFTTTFDTLKELKEYYNLMKRYIKKVNFVIECNGEELKFLHRN